LELGKGGIGGITKRFFLRPLTIELRLRSSSFDDEVMKQEAMSNEY